MLNDQKIDEYFMQQALQQAKIAEENGEVPVGAIVVCKKTIIAKAHNQTEQLNDVTAHAEMIAITSATNYLNSKYLNECTIYVTLEPCLMCASAMMWAQLGKVVYGATDLKKGFNNYDIQVLHKNTVCEHGLLESECGHLLTNFFRKKRK